MQKEDDLVEAPTEEDNNSEQEPESDPEIISEDEKLFEADSYKDGVIFISNYKQLLLIGTDTVLTSTDHIENEIELGKPVYIDKETQVTYANDAHYLLVSDIALPDGECWELSEKFEGVGAGMCLRADPWWLPDSIFVPWNWDHSTIISTCHQYKYY